MGLGSFTDFSDFGEDGGVGVRFGSCGDVLGAGESSDVAESEASRKFCKPLRFGTRKLYAIGTGADGGWPSRLFKTSAEFAIYSRADEAVSMSYRDKGILLKIVP